YIVGLGEVAVQNEKRNFPIASVVRGSSIHVSDRIQSGNFVCGGLHQQVQHCAFGKLQSPTVGIVDRLLEQTVGIGHDRSDHVHQLRQAGELYTIRIAEQGIDQSPDQQSVFQVIDLFQKVRCFLAVAVHRIPVSSAIPDIPLVERKPKLLG